MDWGQFAMIVRGIMWGKGGRKECGKRQLELGRIWGYGMKSQCSRNFMGSMRVILGFLVMEGMAIFYRQGWD